MADTKKESIKDDVKDTKKFVVDLAKEIDKMTRRWSDLVEEQQTGIKSLGASLGVIAKASEDTHHAMDKTTKKFKNLFERVKDLGEEFSRGDLNNAQKVLAKMRKEIVRNSDAWRTNQDAAKAAIEELNGAEEILKNILVLSRQIKGEKLMQMIGLNSAFEKMEEMTKGVPIVGKLMSEQVNKYFTTMKAGVMESLAKLRGGASISASIAGQWKEILSNLGNAAGLAILAKLVMDLMKWFGDMNDSIIEMNKATGLVNNQWKPMRQLVINVNSELAQYGVTAKVAAESVAALYNTFGNTDRVTKKLVETTSLMVVNLGLSADEASEFANTMMAVGNLTDQQLANLTGSTIELAKAAKVAPKKVMQDIAKSTEYINKYMRGNTVEAIKASVAMTRMGLSLEKAGKMADTLLNWDENITNEMDASVMLGRQFNLQRARALAWEGKIGEAAEATLEQIGSINEWDKMNVLQKQAIAKAAGLEMSEISKSLKQRELIAQMTDAEKKKYEDMKAQLSDMNDMSKERILREQSIQVETQKMSQAWDKIVATVAPFLTDILLPILGQVANILGFIGDTIKWVTDLIGIDMNKAMKIAIGTVTALWLATLGPVGAIAALIVGGITLYTAATQKNEYTPEVGKKPETPMATGGLVTSPTHALVGENGPEIVTPVPQELNTMDAINSIKASMAQPKNPTPGTPETAPDTQSGKELAAKMDDLISIMRNGFGVFIDGQKAGDAIAKNTPHPALSQT